MIDNRIEPTTIYLGKKADQLLKQLAAENGISYKFFFTKMLVREARAEATTLTSDKMKERLALIDSVNDELVELINNPPIEMLGVASTNRKAIYTKIWSAHQRLEQRGWSAEDIHKYCLNRYGLDFAIDKTPTKSPKRNPEWCGGGRVAAKIKQARKISVQLIDTEQKPNRPLDTEDTASEK